MFVEAKLFHKANESGGGGGGAVESVNGKTGVVVLTGANINATVAGITDTVTDHITTLKNDLGDLGDVVSTKAEKVEIILTGESGTLTAEQISALTNADNVVSIVCDGQPFYLSNKDSTLTYRTYINTDCAVSSDVEFKAIYVQLNSEAANYGAWTLEEVSTGGGGLPDQTGHSGEFLTTDGTDASWTAVNALQNTATHAEYSLGIATTTPVTTYHSVVIGPGATATNNNSVVVGKNAKADGAKSIAINSTDGTGQCVSKADSIIIGTNPGQAQRYQTIVGFLSGTSYIPGYGSAVLGSAQFDQNDGAGSGEFWVCLHQKPGTYDSPKKHKLLDYDGTIPTDRLVHSINKYSTMPTAAAGNAGWIVQFTGTTDATYTHGHLYECVSDGQTPATYSWTEVQLGGGSSYTAGTGIDITSGVISVTSPTLQNTATGPNSYAVATPWPLTGSDSAAIGGANGGNYLNGTCCGVAAKCKGNYATAFGSNAEASSYSVALGRGAKTSASNSIQINAGTSYQTNSDANTFKVANANGNFEIMSADGTIPADRLADTTNAQQGDVLTLDSNGDAVWQAGGAGGGLQNKAISSDSLTILGEGTSNTESVNIGRQSEVHDDYSVVYGNYARTSYSKQSVVIGFNAAAIDTVSTQQYYNVVCGYAAQVRDASNGIAIGNQAFVGANGAMQFGCGGNTEAGTVCFALTTSNDDSGFTNYKLLDSDGTIPAARHASLPTADGTYVLKLVITDGVPTLSWVAE